MKKIKQSTKIAPEFTVRKWQALRPTLIKDFCKEGLPESWKEAQKVCEARIMSRFIDPLDRIIATDQKDGEGFAIMSILCLLLEHLACWRAGLIYVLGKNDEQLYPYEYNNSSGIFKNFLSQEEPFKFFFTSKTKAYNFYKNVRCGLLHEARTKEEWIIRYDSNRREMLWNDAERQSIVINRHSFYAGLINWVKETFLPSLEMILSKDDNGEQDEAIKKKVMIARANFIRKMDDLCDEKPKIIRCFAYGSNILQKQMEDRLPGLYFKFMGIAKLDGFTFAFNKVSNKDHTGKANIGLQEAAYVLGAIYEIEPLALQVLGNFEGGYELKELNSLYFVGQEETLFSAQTFIANQKLEMRNPSKEYVKIIRSGMIERSFPAEYIYHVLRGF